MVAETAGLDLAKAGIGYYVFDDPPFIAQVQAWLESLGPWGYQGPPFEWIALRD